MDQWRHTHDANFKYFVWHDKLCSHLNNAVYNASLNFEKFSLFFNIAKFLIKADHIRRLVLKIKSEKRKLSSGIQFQLTMFKTKLHYIYDQTGERRVPKLTWHHMLTSAKTKKSVENFFQETLTSVRVIFQNKNDFTERVFDKTFYSLFQNDIGNKKRKKNKKPFY